MIYDEIPAATDDATISEVAIVALARAIPFGAWEAATEKPESGASSPVTDCVGGAPEEIWANGYGCGAPEDHRHFRSVVVVVDQNPNRNCWHPLRCTSS